MMGLRGMDGSGVRACDMAVWPSAAPAAGSVARVRATRFFRGTVSACLAALCLSLAFVGASASATTTYVDGISDQHLANWEGGVSNLFTNAWVGSPPSHIKLARYVVQWNARTGGGYANELANFRSWYERAGALGLTRDVALANYTGTAPSSATYQAELTSFLNEFSGIRYLEAWNEPNHMSTHVNFYVSPVAAAHYMNSAYSVCQSHSCTAIAGDFHDEEHMPKYEEEYEEMLTPSNPGNWGIHPYHTVLRHNPAPVNEFTAKLPSGTNHIWFTEIGAYYCQAGESTPRGEAVQAGDAGWLVNTLIPQTGNLEHVFYYEYAFEGTARINCSASEDTELYAPPSAGQPNQPRSAASIVFGPEGPPTATTGSSSGLQPLQATISGSVNPQGIDDARYYFQYGTTPSYGSSTPQGDAGQSLNSIPESATLTTGIQPGTLYHYRLVATSAAGTGYGSDQTFTTPGPVEAVTGTATAVQQTQATLNGTVNPRGYDAKYHYEYGLTTAYSVSTPESDAGAGQTATSTPVAIVGLEPGAVYHYRLIATSGGVRSNGADNTFVTPADEARWTIANASTGYQWAFTRGSTGELAEVRELGTGWAAYNLNVKMAAGTHASVVRDPATGYRWVFIQGSNGDLAEVRELGTGWAAYDLHVTMAPGTSPSVIRDPASGYRWVFVQGSNGELAEVRELGTGWAAYNLHVKMAAGTSPSAIRAPSSQYRWVFVHGSNGDLAEVVEPGTGWGAFDLNVTMAPNTSPSVIRDALSGYRWVFVQGSNGELAEVRELGTGWAAYNLNVKMAPNTSPSANRDAGSAYRWVFVQGRNGELAEVVEPGMGWGAFDLNVTMAAGASPSSMRYSLPNHLSIFLQGSNNHLWNVWEPGTGWGARDLNVQMG